jgi:inhibitor of the pro-sigma K processing machinery
MIFEAGNNVFIFLFGIILLLIIGRIFLTPIKFILKFLLNSVIGVLVLLLLSFLGKFIGLIIYINLFNVIVSAILGVPGIILILMLKWIGFG